MDELSLFFSSDVDLCKSENIYENTAPLEVSRALNNSSPFCRIKKLGFNVLTFNTDGQYTEDSFGLSYLNSNTILPERTEALPLNLPPEVEHGNIEYKLKLVEPTNDRFEHLVTQMNWRLAEGDGEAIYRLGVDDSGIVTGLTAYELNASLLTLYRMAERLQARLKLLRQCNIFSDPLKESVVFIPHCKAVELLVRRSLPVNQGLRDLRVACLGSMDVGKSTLIGVLTDGELDNGRGQARLNLFRHLHEVQTGHTSSLGVEVIGFDATGRVINRQRPKGQLSRRTLNEVMQASNHLITLLDLAGHPKYQRITWSGLAFSQPAVAILVVSGPAGLTSEGLDHARIVAALGIPLAVVITKSDLLCKPPTASPQGPMDGLKAWQETAGPPSSVSTNSIDSLKMEIFHSLRSIICADIDINNGDIRAIQLLRCFRSNPPIFALSNVTGCGLDDLLSFLSCVSTLDFSKPTDASLFACPRSIRKFTEVVKQPRAGLEVEFWVDNIYRRVPGVNSPVFCGILRHGEIHNSQKLWLGPYSDGSFVAVKVLELRRNRQPHGVLKSGQSGSLVLSPLDYTVTSSLAYNWQDFKHARRGMVLLSERPLRIENLPHDSTQYSAGVCWSLGISNIVWLPSTGEQQKRSLELPALKTTLCVYSGNICQRARLADNSISMEHSSRLMEALHSLPSYIIHLRTQKLVLSFTHLPEYTAINRQVILAWGLGLKAVGYVSDLLDVVSFSKPTTLERHSSTSESADNIDRHCITPLAADFVDQFAGFISGPEELVREAGIILSEFSTVHTIDAVRRPEALERFLQPDLMHGRGNRISKRARRRKRIAPVKSPDIPENRYLHTDEMTESGLPNGPKMSSENSSSTSTWCSINYNSQNLNLDQSYEAPRSFPTTQSVSVQLVGLPNESVHSKEPISEGIPLVSTSNTTAEDCRIRKRRRRARRKRHKH